MGWMADSLKIAVPAPAEKGKANKAVLKFLAKLLALSPSDLQLVQGDTSSNKVVKVPLHNEEIVRLVSAQMTRAPK